MDKIKVRTIKNLGTGISAFSGFAVFSNGMGLLSMNLMFSDGELSNDPIFSNYNLIAGTALILSIGLLICGLFIRKHKEWARKSAQWIFGIMIIAIWTLTIFIGKHIPVDGAMPIVSSLIGGLFFSIPFVLIIWYLNKENVKTLFK